MSRLLWISLALFYVVTFVFGASCPRGEGIKTFRGTCHLCIPASAKEMSLESHCYRLTNGYCMDAGVLSAAGKKARGCKGRQRKITCTCPASMTTSFEDVASTIEDPGVRMGKVFSKGGSKALFKPGRKSGGSKTRSKASGIPLPRETRGSKTRSKASGIPLPRRTRESKELSKARFKDTSSVVVVPPKGKPKGKPKKRTKRSKGKKGKSGVRLTPEEFERFKETTVNDNLGPATDPLYAMGFYFGLRVNANNIQFPHELLRNEFHKDTAESFKSRLAMCNEDRFIPGQKYTYLIVNVDGTNEIRYISMKEDMALVMKAMAEDPTLEPRSHAGEVSLLVGHASLISRKEDAEFSKFMVDPEDYGEKTYVTKIRYGGEFKVAEAPNENGDQCIVWWDNSSGHFKRNSKWSTLIKKVFGFQGEFRLTRHSDSSKIVAKVDYLNYFHDGDSDREYDDNVIDENGGLVDNAKANDGRSEKDLSYGDVNYLYRHRLSGPNFWNGFVIGSGAFICIVLVFVMGLGCGMLGCWGYNMQETLWNQRKEQR
eukprot:238056_1